MKRILFLLVVLGFVSQVNSQVIFYAESPAPLVGNYEMSWAFGGGWGTLDLNTLGNSIVDTLVFASDGTAADSLVCNPVTNGPQITGKIAVIYRGGCEFGAKALAAQNAGAIGVVIINNIPGSPIAMGGGAVGASVIIPVVMITQADGAALKADIEAGNVSAFIGSKFGYYPNDLGMWPKDFILAPATSNPRFTNSVASEFTVAIGSWIFNFGQNDQTNVSLKGSITYSGGSVYSNTTPVGTILAGDSLWVQLPNFNQATYPAGLYKFQYTITADSIDDFPDDNWRRADFTISDTLFSYAPIDTVTLMPITNATYRPSGGGIEFQACISFRDSLANRLYTTGMYFVASTPIADSLNGIFIETVLYEWNDVFTDVTGPPTFTSLNPILFGGYTYPSNQQNQLVWAPFTTTDTLNNNQRYLFCVHTFDDFVYLGYGTTSDYDEHINTYLQPVSPVNNDGAWNWIGFGSDVVPSIGVKMFDKNTLGDESVSIISNAKPYPNPATNMVYIPVNNITGKMEISILDMQGRVLKSEVKNITTPGSLPVNIDGVSNGQYIIRLTANGNITQSFKIMINN